MTVQHPLLKACRKCKAVKPVGEFGRQSSRADGYRRRCKSCERELRKQREQKKAKWANYQEQRAAQREIVRQPDYAQCQKCGLHDWWVIIERNGGHCDICPPDAQTPRANDRYPQDAMPLPQTLSAYGMDDGDWRALFEKQGCGCAVCGRGDPGGSVWHTDHDHDVERLLGTVFVRGILCNRCNAMLATTRAGWTENDACLRYLADPPGRIYHTNDRLIEDADYLNHSAMHNLAKAMLLG